MRIYTRSVGRRISMTTLQLVSKTSPECVKYEKTDNVVAIKQRLQGKINIREVQLQLFLDGEPLDNNRYLPDGTARLEYQIIEGDSSDVIIKVARNKYNIPKLIQIGKNNSIGQLERVLASFSDSLINLAIFTESDEPLDIDKTVEQSGLIDDSVIRVCDRDNMKFILAVSYINQKEQTLQIQCNITDTVCKVKERICSKVLDLTADEISLFSDWELLETDRRLIDHSIGGGDLILYVHRHIYPDCMTTLQLVDESITSPENIDYEKTDNVVAIKQKLQSKINIREVQLQLLLDGEPLDNNRYLPDGTARLEYQIIEGDSSDVIIKVARNKYKIPKLIQIGKSDSIGQLERLLASFSGGVVNLAIFSESGERLETRSTLEQSELVNDSVIRVCDEKDVSLTLGVVNINQKEQAFRIQCNIIDTIRNVKEKICSKVKNLIVDEMSLFSEFDFLETDRQLIDYFIGDGDFIFYVDLHKKDEIVVWNKFKTGQFATLHYGRNLTTNSEIVVKKYSLNKGDKLSNVKALKYEITTFLQLRDEANSRFVKLNSMFEEKSKFFIGMEHMKGGSLDALLPLNVPFDDPESTIINFSIQILEGLAFLHEKLILYRSMKCSSVLLDETCTTVKLGSFHLSKYMQGEYEENLLKGLTGSRPTEYNWAAPEMLLNEPYGVKADIWSFGATLVEMVTGQAPYANLKTPQVLDKITTLKKIEYTQPDWMSDDLKDAIGECLQPNQEMRPTANGLKELFVNL